MPHLKLGSVLKEFLKEIVYSQKLARAALKWRNQGTTSPSFSEQHLELTTEYAFLKAYLAWEAFLEESFLLYLLGKPDPTNYRPQRYVLPTNREHAVGFVIGEGRYSDWTATDIVLKRAGRCFRGGEPFNSALRPLTNKFQDLKTVRNAAVHASGEARDKLDSLIRRELGHLPTGSTVGRFLLTNMPNATPPETYFDHYMATIQQTARRIVR